MAYNDDENTEKENFFTDRRGNPKIGNILKAVVGGVIPLALVFASVVTTGETEAKVITTMGKFSTVTSPGVSFKAPLLQSEKSYDLALQTMSIESPKTATADNQNLEHVVVTAQFKIDPNKVEELYKTAPNYEANLSDWLQKAQKDALGVVNTIDLTEQRQAVSDDMMSRFQALIDDGNLPITVVTVNLKEFDWDDTFEKSIQNNMQAKNDVEKAASVNREKIIQAETAKVTAKGVADAAREAAKGAADATKTKAEASAYKTEINAKADAKATELNGAAEAGAFKAKVDAFGDAATFVDFTKAKNWDGKLPDTVVGNSGSGTSVFLDSRSAGAAAAAVGAPKLGR